jgi:hypothetical protein
MCSGLMPGRTQSKGGLAAVVGANNSTEGLLTYREEGPRFETGIEESCTAQEALLYAWFVLPLIVPPFLHLLGVVLDALVDNP